MTYLLAGWLIIGALCAVAWCFVEYPWWWPIVFLTLLGPISLGVVLPALAGISRERAERARLKVTEDENYAALKALRPRKRFEFVDVRDPNSGFQLAHAAGTDEITANKPSQ